MSEPEPAGGGDLTRRAVIKAAGAVVGAAAFAAALAPLLRWQPATSINEYLRKHYQELTPDELAAICRRVEADTKAEHGVEVSVAAPQPTPGAHFGYALNLSVCIGCRMCAEACHKENNHDRATHNSYIRVFELDENGIDLATGNAIYDHPVRAKGKYYLPVQCHHCDNAPCVKTCPTGATWQEPDGLVVVDYNWCIGCRYCEAACPYHARRFNWKKPEIPAAAINPDQGYLSNRIRPAGVMEKCTFCLHRTRVGRLPACVEACPTGARVFGNLADPDSELRWVLANKRVFILKEDLGTKPRFFYFFYN
jgi:Fe-S-cluster-containing dehydrogenase component